MRIQSWRPRVHRLSRDQGPHARDRRTEDGSREAREAALTAVAGVVAAHLRDEDEHATLRGGDDARPLLVHVDGPGKTTFLQRLAGELDPQAGKDRAGWTVVSFDAWQHQRVDPPWWW